MQEHRHIEILIEDESGKKLAEQIMSKYTAKKENLTYEILGFKGIGKIPLNLDRPSQAKPKTLLTALPMYLRGFDASLKSSPGEKAVFVILDRDDADCIELKKDLVRMYEGLGISIEVFFCIAIEEMEDWLLGDSKALLNAYPQAKYSLLNRYEKEEIEGTWEYLADVIYKGGAKRLKKTSSYYEIGAFKCKAAEEIGQRMDIRKNRSPSFNYFIRKLDQFCGGE